MTTRNQINDAKWMAFDDVGLIGANPDRELQWLHGNGATSPHIADAWREFLISQLSLPPENYQRNDWWYRLLGDLGYTGQLNDRELQFWKDGGLIALTPPEWTGTVPNFTYYENELPATVNMNAWVYSNPKASGWSTTAFSIDTEGILTVTGTPGTYPTTVTATNVHGSTPSNQFTITILAGTRPTIPVWSQVPDQTTQFGSPDSLDCKNYCTSHIAFTLWEMSGGPGAIDQNGVITLTGAESVGAYQVTVTAHNSNGPASSNVFQWIVAVADGDAADFYESRLGSFNHSRAGTEDVPDYRAITVTAPTDIPAFVGGRYGGAGNWFDESVGYGLRINGTPGTNVTATFDDMNLSGGSTSNDFCGHVIWHHDENFGSQVQFARLFNFGTEALDNRFIIYYDTGVLKCQMAVGGVAVAEIDLGAPPAGPVLDIRFLVSVANGIKVWVNQGAAVTDASTAGFSVRQNFFAVGSNGSAVYFRGDCVHHRIVPIPLDDAVILAWPAWSEPAIIITKDPVSISVDAADPAVFTGDWSHPYGVMLWEASSDNGATWQDATLHGGVVDGDPLVPGDVTRRLTFNNTGGLGGGLQVRFTVTDELSRTETSAVATLTVTVPEYTHNFDASDLGEWTYTRASEATFLNHIAQIDTVPEDEPAFEGGNWDGVSWTDEGVGYGIQLEPGTTNVYRGNTILDDTGSWVHSGLSVQPDPSVTDPFGNNEAFRVTVPGADNNIHQSGSVSAGYGSIWLKAGNADNIGRPLFIIGGNASGQIIGVPEEWTRVGFAVSDAVTIHYLLDTRPDATADNVLMYLPQWETGLSYPTSVIYTPTDAAVTRAPTNISSQLSALTPLPSTLTNDFCGQAVFVLGFDVADLTSEVRLFTFGPGDIDELFAYINPTDDRLYLAHIANSVVTGTSVDVSAFVTHDVIDVRFKVSSTEGIKLWVNTVKATDATPAANYSTPIDRVQLGARWTGTQADRHIAAKIPFIRIVPAALADEAIEDLDKWVEWTPPVPVITLQPSDVHIGEGSGPPPVEPPTEGLIQSANMTYAGSFTIPREWNGGPVKDQDVEAGGTVLAVSEDGTYLYINGHSVDNATREFGDHRGTGRNGISRITIPAIDGTAAFDINMQMIEYDRNYGNMNSGGGGDLEYPNDVNPGWGYTDGAEEPRGGIVHNGRLIIAVDVWYDNFASKGNLTHCVVDATDLTTWVTAPGNIYGDYQSSGSTRPFINQMICKIPQDWQAAFGGNDAFVGGGTQSIVTGCPNGFSLFACKLDDIGVTNPFPVQPAYYNDFNNPLSPRNCPENSGSICTNDIWTHATKCSGVFWPEGTRSIIFIGRHGYGTPTYKEESPDGCDKADEGEGAAPYRRQAWAYDANDILAAFNGETAINAPTPYAWWELPDPSTDTCRLMKPGGLAYDPISRKVYYIQNLNDSYGYKVHVLDIAVI